MKKLVVALAMVAFVAGVQAATFSWTSGQLFKPADATGVKGSGTANAIRNATGDTLSWYVFAALDATDYAAAQNAGTVYGWLTTAPESGTKLAPATQGTANTARATEISSDAFSAKEAVNWAAVIVYTDGDGVKWYTEAYGSDTFNDLGATISKTDLGKNVTTWTKAAGSSGGDVPEPTSGLLLVVGGALLALRRKQK